MVHRDGAVGLDRATFAIGRGDLAFVIGPPHSGKSTVLRLLTRELRPSGGAVWAVTAGRYRRTHPDHH